MIKVFRKLIGYFWIVVLASGLVLVWSSWPPAMAEIKHNGHETNSLIDMDNQAGQIKILLGAVILLFGGNMFWARRELSKRDAKDEVFRKELRFVRSNMDKLMGEHKVLTKNGICAFSQASIETAMEDAIIPVIEKYHKNMENKLRENLMDKDC